MYDRKKNCSAQNVTDVSFFYSEVTRGRWTIASALEVGDEAVTHLVLGGDRAVLQAKEPGASSILESHGKPVRHDHFVVVGRFDAQLIEP